MMQWLYLIIIIILALVILIQNANQLIEKIADFFEKIFIRLIEKFDGKTIALISKFFFRKLKEFRLKRQTNKVIFDFKNSSTDPGVDLIGGIEICESSKTATTVLNTGKKILVLYDRAEESQRNVNKIIHEIAGNAIPNGKTILPETEKRCVHFKLTTSLLERHSQTAVRKFINDYRDDYEQLRTSDFYAALDVIDQKGLFDRIYLCDLMDYGHNSHDYRSNVANLQKTSIDYTKFLTELSKLYLEKTITDRTLLTFNDANGISSNIMLVAREESVKERNVSPYIDKARELIGQGIRHLYVLSYSQPHNLHDTVHWGKILSFTNQVIRELKKLPQLELHSKVNFKVNVGRGVYPVTLALLKKRKK